MSPEILFSASLLPSIGLALLLGLLSPLVGIFLVMRRFSLLADTLAHVSLLGVALSVWLSLPMTSGALVSAVIGGCGIELLRQSRRVLSEATLAIFLSGSLALALILFALRGVDGEELEQYLFGNLASVTNGDFLVFVIVTLGVISFFLFSYRRLFLITLDEELAQVSGVAVRRLNFLFMLLASVVVAVAIKVVGVLLVSALIVLPVMAAIQWRQGFRQTLLLSCVFSESAVLSGFILAYTKNLPSGAAIALMALATFIVSFLIGGRTRPSRA